MLIPLRGKMVVCKADAITMLNSDIDFSLVKVGEIIDVQLNFVAEALGDINPSKQNFISTHLQS